MVDDAEQPGVWDELLIQAWSYGITKCRSFG